MSTTPVRTEWKKKKVDRSKRVAPGATIDEKNILTKPRRKGAKLTVEQRNKENKPSNKKVEKTEKVEKKVEKIEKKVEKVEKVEKKVEKVVEAEKTPLEDVTEKVESMKVTVAVEEKPKTPTKSRKSNTKTKGISSKVATQIERLGGKLKEEVGERRFYRDSETPMPIAIQLFCDAFVGKESQKFCSSKHKLEEVTFGQEFTLEEFEDFKYLKKDDILIGDGESLIVVNGKDTREDFEICMVEDEDSKPVGPYKISDFLKSLEATEIAEEE